MKPFDGYIAMDKEEEEPPFTTLTNRRTVWRHFEDAILHGWSVYVTVIKTADYDKMQSELTRLRELEVCTEILEQGQKQARGGD